MSDYSYPIDDESVVWDFFNDDTYVVPEQTRPRLPAAPVKSFCDLAREAVETERVWCRGASATIWQSERHTVTVSYSAAVGDLYLVLQNATERVSIRCARLPMFVPGADVGGYVFTLTDDDYQKWAAKAHESR